MNLAMLMAIMSGQAMMLSTEVLNDVARSLAGLRENASAADFQKAVKSVRAGAPMSLSGAKTSSSGAMQRVGSVGIVDIWGVLMKSPGDVRDGGDRFGTSYDEIRAGVFESRQDKDVKTIMLRMDTPGGAAIPAETAATEIFGIARDEAGGKPVVAISEGMMASAGFYLGSQASVLYVTPSGLVGSIGTRMDMWNFKGLLDKFGISVDTIKSTWAKDIGNPFKAMGEKERAVLQAEVNAFDRQFVGAVMRGRGVDAKTVADWQSIRVKMGQDAVDAGMADAVVNSTEQLVGMLNQNPEKYARRTRSAVSMPAALSLAADGGVIDVNAHTSAAVAAGTTAANAAEGDMARMMMGIAGVAAGLGNLAPDAGGGAGGGGGSSGQTPSTLTAGLTAGERDRIAAEATAAANQANLDRTNAIMAAAIPFAGNEAIQKVRDEAIGKGWTLEQFHAAAVKNLAPKPLGKGPEEVGNRPTPVGMGEEQCEKFGNMATMGIIARYCPSAISMLEASADGLGSASPRSERAFQVRAGRDIAKHWGFGNASAALEAVQAAASAGLVMMSQREIAMRSLANSLGISMDAAMQRFVNPESLFDASIVRRSRGGGVDAIAGGVSSSDFPGLLLNVANKVQIAAFDMKETFWQKIAPWSSAADFKIAYMVGVSETGKFVLLPENAPIPETRPVERKETVQVKKHGIATSYTFEAQVNDDMGMLINSLMGIGEMAKYIPDDLLVAKIKANSFRGPTMLTDNKAMCHADHKNILTAAPFGYDSVRAMRKLARNQVGRGPDAVQLQIEIEVLLVPTDLSDKAEELVNQEWIPNAAGPQNQRNLLRGQIDYAHTNQLGTDIGFQGFVRAGRNSPYEVKFLFGQQTPTVKFSNQSDMSALRLDAMLPGVEVGARSWEGTVVCDGEAEEA